MLLIFWLFVYNVIETGAAANDSSIKRTHTHTSFNISTIQSIKIPMKLQATPDLHRLHPIDRYRSISMYTYIATKLIWHSRPIICCWRRIRLAVVTRYCALTDHTSYM